MTDSAAARRPVAAFDFDGTISRRDTLGPFLARVVGVPALGATLVRHLPRLVAVSAGRADRDEEKQRVIRRLLGGRTEESVLDCGRQYAERLWDRQRFRPAILERLAWHRAVGHTVVVVSASLEVYLTPLATQLGIDHVIGCRLGVDPAGLLTGELVGGNVRGPEKERRLRQWLGTEPVELWAYGDSSGDDELLAMADHPTRV